MVFWDHKNIYIFLSVSVSIRILLDEDSNIRGVYSGYVEWLLKNFFMNCIEHYGGIFKSYTTHSLWRLASHLKTTMKKYAWNAQNPVAQIVKGISELKVCSNRHNKKFIHMVVGTKSDTWFLLNSGSFAYVIECKEHGFVCDVLSSHHAMNFYSDPLRSKLINIFHIKNFNNKVKKKMLMKDHFQRKFVSLP